MKAFLIVTALSFSLSAAAEDLPKILSMEPTDIGVKVHYSNGVVTHVEKCTPYYVGEEDETTLYQCTSLRYRVMLSPNGDVALIRILRAPR
jgi:hypothetical protein